MEKKEKITNKGKIAVTLMRMITVIVVCIVILFVTYAFIRKDEPEITSTFISEKLETVSELTTARLTYNGIVEYSDGDIPFLTRKGFNMIYRAEVSAGIDLSQVEIDVTREEVRLTLPEEDVLDISIDSNSIKFYDEKFALFNWEDREDAVEAIKAAEEDVRENGNVEELKVRAREQTEVVLKGLLENVIGDRQLVIQ